MNLTPKLDSSMRYFNLLIIILHIATIVESSLPLTHLRFTNDSYTGYISENVARPSLPANTVSSTNRHNRNIKNLNSTQTDERSSTIYVRFVDKLKPAVVFDEPAHAKCRDYSANLHAFKFELYSEYDTDSLTLFALDTSSFECFTLDATLKTCACYLKLRLIDDTAREKLNREAKDTYYVQIRVLTNETTSVRVNVLDDNDLEPMFDTNEYVFDLFLSESRVMPAFSVIGRVAASDPDLSKNALVRYYLNCESPQTPLVAHCNTFFGVNWLSGEVYLKKPLGYLFTHYSAAQNELSFEINAIDSGVKLSLAKNLLRLNETMQFYARKEEDSSDLEHKLISIAADPMLNSVYALNRSYSSLISSGFTRLEAATVRIRLVRDQSVANFVDLNKTRLEKIDFSPLSAELREQIRFRLNADSARIPFAVLRVHINASNTRPDHNLRVLSADNRGITFKLAKLYVDFMPTYLVYFEMDSTNFFALKTNTSSVHDYVISYCDTETCLSLAEFKFDLVHDLIAIFTVNCGLDLNVPSKFQLSGQANTTLFAVRSRVTSVFDSDVDFCATFATYRLNSSPDLFHVKYSVNLDYFSINQWTGVVQTSARPVIIERGILRIEASLHFGAKMLLTRRDEACLYEVVEQTDLALEFIRANPASTLTYLHIKWQSGQTRHRIHVKNIAKNIRVTHILHCQKSVTGACPFYLERVNGVLYLILSKNESGTGETRTDLLVKLSELELVQKMPSYLSLQVSWPVVVSPSSTLDFANKDCFVGVYLTATNSSKIYASPSKFYTSINNNYLDKPIKLIQMQILSTNANTTRKYAYSLKVQNEHIDTQCFYAEDGWVYLKCKLPFSVLKHFQKSKSAADSSQTVARVLSVQVEDRVTRKQASTHLSVVFSVDNTVQRVEEVSVSTHILNCTAPRQLDDEIEQKNAAIFENLIYEDNRARILSLTKSNLSTSAKFYNKTHLSLVYLISSASLKAGSPIWQLKSDDPQDICSFSISENSANKLFRIENGFLKTSLDWKLPWQSLTDNYKYSIVLGVVCFRSHAYNLRVDVNFSLENFAKINYTLADIPAPRLANSHFDLALNVTKASRNDLLLVEKFATYLTYDNTMLNDTDIDSKLFNVSYAVKQLDTFVYVDLPFYVDPHKGQLFYFSSVASKLTTQAYEFYVVVNFDFLYKENLSFNLHATVRVQLEVPEVEVLATKSPQDLVISGTLDFSLPVTSTDLLAYLKCPLIAYFRLNPNKNASFKLLARETPAGGLRKKTKVAPSKKSPIFYHTPRSNDTYKQVMQKKIIQICQCIRISIF